jgi:hypothetical protein
MKRVLIASLFSLAAAPVFASAYNDFPEQGTLEASRAASVTSLPQPSFNDQADVDVLKINAGLAGRAASEVAQPRNTLWTPAY